MRTSTAVDSGRGRCFVTREGRRGGCAGFTLIEVLVVVAIIALLIAILLPSLATARENARRTVCGAQLKEMAHAMVMYGGENKDSLPGPLHQALELETVGKTASNDYEAWHLPHYIRRYFGDTSKEKKLTDNVLRCPTALKVFGDKNKWTDTQAERPFTYTLNNWWTIGDPKTSDRVGTNPQQYFGWPGGSSDPALRFWNGGPDGNGRFQVNPAAGELAKPKRIQKIRQLAREWALGDAFRYSDANRPQLTGTGRRNGDWRIGTYQSDWIERIAHADQPFHTKGINVAMFDGHVEYQRPWRGSVNSDVP